jgi:hypothetical protein
MNPFHLIPLLIATALWGCAAKPKICSTAKPGVDYTRFQTFVLRPLPTSGPASDPGLMLRLAEPAQRIITEQLTAKGLTIATTNNADLAVNLRGQSIPRVEVRDWGYEPAPLRVRGGWYYTGTYRDVDLYNYEENRLIIEIFENRSQELVWVGWSESRSTGAVPTEKFEQMLRSILALFPPPSP